MDPRAQQQHEQSVLPPISKRDMDSASNMKREEADIQAAEAILSIAPTHHHSAKSSASYPASLPPFNAASSQQSSPAESHPSPHDDRIAASSDGAAMRQSLPSLSEALGRPQPPASYTRERSPPRSYLRRSASPRASRYSREPESYPRPSQRHSHTNYRELSPAQQPAPRPVSYAPIGVPSPSSPRRSFNQQWPMPPPPPSHVAHSPYGPATHIASPTWPPSQSTRPTSVHQSSSFAAQPFYAQQYGEDQRPPTSQQQQYVTSYPTLSTAPLPASHEPSWPASDKYGDPGRQASRDHSDAVKKQLEHYDIETSLNDIQDCSHNLMQFSQIYKARQTHNARSDSGTEPSIEAVKEAMRFNQLVGDALGRILDKLQAQEEAERAAQRSAQEAIEKEKATQKQVDQHQAASDAASHHRRASGPTMAGEVKKRRGRQALPGRCHSCHRSETPEWRRGPDGARTLCNACGLHYAKHARKQGANKAALGPSNLRQKPLNTP